MSERDYEDDSPDYEPEDTLKALETASKSRLEQLLGPRRWKEIVKEVENAQELEETPVKERPRSQKGRDDWTDSEYLDALNSGDIELDELPDKLQRGFK